MLSVVRFWSVGIVILNLLLPTLALAAPPAPTCDCTKPNFGIEDPYASGGLFLKCSVVCTGTTKDKEGRLLGVFSGPETGRETYTGGDVTAIIGKVINSIVLFLGVIFLVLAIWSGGSWMLAGGDKEKVSAARGTLSAAVIGVIITASAYVIMNFVFNELITRALSVT